MRRPSLGGFARPDPYGIRYLYVQNTTGPSVTEVVATGKPATVWGWIVCSIGAGTAWAIQDQAGTDLVEDAVAAVGDLVQLDWPILSSDGLQISTTMGVNLGVWYEGEPV